MNIAKHTPGPWIKMDCLKSLVIYGPSGYIAELVRFTDKHNTEANAQLIAAAPELLEALKSIESWAGTWGNEKTALYRIGDLAYKAIAKVEGK